MSKFVFIIPPNELSFSVKYKFCFLYFQGLKTGMTKMWTKTVGGAATDTPSKQVQTTEETHVLTEEESQSNLADMVCSLDNREACLACGS